MMEFLDSIFDALNGGVDTLSEGIKPLIAVYVVYLLARARTALLKGVPAWLHAIVASGIEQYLMPIVINAVKAAEEYGARRAKDLLEQGREVVKTHLSAEKVGYARQYVLDRVPDWLVPDERLGKMIDAALIAIGRGATKGVTIGVEVIDEQIGRIPPPPAA